MTRSGFVVQSGLSSSWTCGYASSPPVSFRSPCRAPSTSAAPAWPRSRSVLTYDSPERSFRAVVLVSGGQGRSAQLAEGEAIRIISETFEPARIGVPRDHPNFTSTRGRNEVQTSRCHQIHGLEAKTRTLATASS
jgi:hypothetical protein